MLELVRVTTGDGLRLDGALRTPPGETPRATVGIDAFLCVHGTGSNFYSSSLLEAVGQAAAEQNTAVLSINTRGHDVISTASSTWGARRQGAAFEIVDDCRHDLAAWIALLVERGYRRILMVGHSLGALKSIYALAHESLRSAETIAGLVAISPPRLSYKHYLASSRGAAFAELMRQAEDHVQASRPETLLDVDFPLPYIVSAAGYVDKYGPAERYNLLNYVNRLQLPTLVTFGSQEVQTNVAFAGLPVALEAIAQQAGNLTVATVAGADHFYAGARAELIDRIFRWLRRW